MIRVEDDLLHRGSDDPYWNESAWFGFTVPDRELTGWVYFYHRPTMRYTVGGVALWDATGEYPWNCRHYDWGTTFPLPDGAEMYDFTLENGLTVRSKEPLRSFALAYRGDGCELELDWEAVAEPQSAVPAGQGLPSGADEFGKGHYNQAGRMLGELRLGGERIDVDCHYARDHSWGPRRFTSNPRGDFASVVASERSGFCVLAAADRPAAEDPCVGVPDPVRFGWYLRDGVTARLVDAHRTVAERGPDGRPLRVEVHGTDELGRELHAVGRCTTALHWNGYGFLFIFWCRTEWEFDGQRAVGEEQDYFPPAQARRLLRG